MPLVKQEKPTYYEKPKFPDYPSSEWRARINKAQKLMAENEIDCLTLWNRENVYYFSAFQTTHWWLPSIQPAILLLFVDREPLLIVPSLLHGLAEALSWVRDMAILEEAHEAPAQRQLPKDVANLIKDLGYGRKNIGLETGPLGCMWIPRPLCDIDAFRDALPDARFVDGENVYWGCRMIKSPFEIDRIRKSVEGIRIIQATLVEEFRPGMSEIELVKILHRKAAELEGTLIRDNAFGLKGMYICSLEAEAVFDVGALDGVTIGKGDYIIIDNMLTYRSYGADNARTFQVGPITDKIKKNYELMWECQDRGGEILKPGITASDLYNATVEPMKAAGLPVLELVGHGVGLINHEPPFLDAHNEIVLQEGMTLSVEPWIVAGFKSQGGDGIFGLQDTFVVTEKGCDKIEGLRRDIIQVSHPIL